MWPLFKVVNLIYVLVSGYIWFGFLLPGNLIPIIVSGFMIICCCLGNFKLRFSPRVYAFLGALVLYFILGTYILGISYGVLLFMSYLPAILIFMLDKPRQHDLLEFVTKWVCYLLAAGIVGFALSFFISMPHSYFVPDGMEYMYSAYENYIIFIKRTAYTEQGLNIVRFSGPFIEPGHLSMVCGVLLFANRFRMKQKPLLWILVGSILLSLSLAGYVILLAGLIMVKIRNVYTIVALLGLGVGVWLTFAVIWNGGDNPVNKMIFERLEYDESKGIKGNNRTIAQTDYYFKHCVEDGSIWLGVRSQKEMKLKIRGAGYKIFLLRYGIVSAVFVAWLYLLLIAPKANKRYAASFFTLIAMLFMQRAYPWSYAWLFSYVIGIGLSRNLSFKEFVSDTTEDDFSEAEELTADTADEEEQEDASEENHQENPLSLPKS